MFGYLSEPADEIVEIFELVDEVDNFLLLLDGEKFSSVLPRWSRSKFKGKVGIAAAVAADSTPPVLVGYKKFI